MYYIPPTLYPRAGLEGRVIISLDKPNVLYTSYFISQGRVGGEDIIINLLLQKWK